MTEEQALNLMYQVGALAPLTKQQRDAFEGAAKILARFIAEYRAEKTVAADPAPED